MTKQAAEGNSPDMRILSEQIYQYKKGVRKLVLHTFDRKYEQLAVRKLRAQHIDYLVQPVCPNGREGCLEQDAECTASINLFFGRKECLDAIRLFIHQPLHKLTPEQDFILGAMLGYDISVQCERYCKRKRQAANIA